MIGEFAGQAQSGTVAAMVKYLYNINCLSLHITGTVACETIHCLCKSAGTEPLPEANFLEMFRKDNKYC